MDYIEGSIPNYPILVQVSSKWSGCPYYLSILRGSELKYVWADLKVDIIETWMTCCITCSKYSIRLSVAWSVHGICEVSILLQQRKKRSRSCCCGSKKSYRRYELFTRSHLSPRVPFMAIWGREHVFQ